MTYNTINKSPNHNNHPQFPEYQHHHYHRHGGVYDDEHGDADTYDYDAADDETSAGSLPTWKNIAVSVIVLACLASIYPKALHPLLMWVSGYGEQMQQKAADRGSGTNDRRSSDRAAGASIHGMHSSRIGDFATPGSSSERFLSTAARMAGHSAARTGAPMMHYESATTAPGEGGTGGGTWHWLLPCYTIGIVMFLLYTLGKVLWRKPNISPRHRYNLRYNPEKDRFEANIPGMESEEEESEENENSIFEDDEERDQFREEFFQHSFLPENDRLRNLQNRLQETESAMQYILTQLEQLSSSDPSEVEHFKETAAATLNNSLKNDQENPPTSSIPSAAAAAASIVGRNQRTDRSVSSSIDGCNRRSSPQSPKYLDDLEHALEDFKRSSEDYVRKHSKKNKSNVKNSRQKEGRIDAAADCKDAKCGADGDPKPTESPINDSAVVDKSDDSNDLQQVLRERQQNCFGTNSESGDSSHKVNRVRHRKRKTIEKQT